MKGFDLSDKELKSLLQEEGIEEPSMGFNKSVLSKIEQYESAKSQPVRIPKWLLLSLFILFVSPAIYMLAVGDFSFGTITDQLELPTIAFDFGDNVTYLWISIFTLVTIWSAVLFDKFLLKTSDSHR